MGRGATAAAVIGAVLAGSVTGLGLHAWRPEPFAGAGPATTSAPAPGPQHSDGPATPSSGPSASPTSSPSQSDPERTGPTGTSASPSPSASPTPAPESSTGSVDPDPDPDPDFDRSVLLRTTDFTAHGWAQARVTDSYPVLPQPPITPCAAILPGQVGLVRGNAGAWSSARTTAQETVGLFTDGPLAAQEFSRLLDEITNCSDANVEIDGFARTASASGVDSIRWWNTKGPDSARGIVGVVRTDNRVAVLAISSPDSDPDDTRAHGTTDVATLLGIAGQRIG